MEGKIKPKKQWKKFPYAKERHMFRSKGFSMFYTNVKKTHILMIFMNSKDKKKILQTFKKEKVGGTFKKEKVEGKEYHKGAAMNLATDF